MGSKQHPFLSHIGLFLFQRISKFYFLYTFLLEHAHYKMYFFVMNLLYILSIALCLFYIIARMLLNLHSVVTCKQTKIKESQIQGIQVPLPYDATKLLVKCLCTVYGSVFILNDGQQAYSKMCERILIHCYYYTVLSTTLLGSM